MKVLLLISIFSLSACSTYSSRSIASIYSETEKNIDAIMMILSITNRDTL